MSNALLKQNTKTISKTPIILCLIFILPVGVYLTFKHRPHWFKKIWFVILLAIYALLWFGVFVSGNSSSYDWSREEQSVKDQYQSICEKRSKELATNTTEYEVCKRVGYPVKEVSTKTITEVEKIAFNEERIDDPSLAKGEEKVERDGIEGEKTVTYDVRLEDGKEVSRDKTKEEVTKEPVNKLIKIGTYVAPATSAPTPSQSSGSSSPNSGVTNTVSGYCNDGTYVTGNPSARGRANACYGHGGWRDY